VKTVTQVATQTDEESTAQDDSQTNSQSDSQADNPIYTVTTLTTVKAQVDTKARSSAKALPLGEQFRRWVFANQSSINKANLRGMAERFADQHDMELPANYDPKGELKKLVLADYALGQQVGVFHTPTVFVVSVSHRGAPFVETLDREKLFAMIEQMQAAEKK
jgi:hypothetical protein